MLSRSLTYLLMLCQRLLMLFNLWIAIVNLLDFYSKVQLVVKYGTKVIKYCDTFNFFVVNVMLISLVVLSMNIIFVLEKCVALPVYTFDRKD